MTTAKKQTTAKKRAAPKKKKATVKKKAAPRSSSKTMKLQAEELAGILMPLYQAVKEMKVSPFGLICYQDGLAFCWNDLIGLRVGVDLGKEPFAVMGDVFFPVLSSIKGEISLVVGKDKVELKHGKSKWEFQKFIKFNHVPPSPKTGTKAIVKLEVPQEIKVLLRGMASLVSGLKIPTRSAIQVVPEEGLCSMDGFRYMEAPADVQGEAVGYLPGRLAKLVSDLQGEGQLYLVKMEEHELWCGQIGTWDIIGRTDVESRNAHDLGIGAGAKETANMVPLRDDIRDAVNRIRMATTSWVKEIKMVAANGELQLSVAESGHSRGDEKVPWDGPAFDLWVNANFLSWLVNSGNQMGIAEVNDMVVVVGSSDEPEAFNLFRSMVDE